MRTSLVTVGAGRHRFTCWVCGGKLFFDREIKLNTSAAEFFNLGWANESATGLVCQRCGYLHTFASEVELWSPEDGYPLEAG
jgi:predicted nucleic-acid-binding Zn-ribbon protein